MVQTSRPSSRIVPPRHNQEYFCIEKRCSDFSTSYCKKDNSEVKHDVYGIRQTAKMKLFLSLISCVYSREKLYVFKMNSSRSCSISVCFIYGLEEKLSLPFAVCR